VVEQALFFDDFTSVGQWLPGPNSKAMCNNVEIGEGPWLWLSGGTDWQLFQGVHRQFVAEPACPRWISFEVRIATPEYSGAFIAFASGVKNWGLRHPALVFSYIGDEREKTKRSFVVQGDPRSYGSSCVVLSDIKPHRAYRIAICLDWASHTMDIWVDGEKRVEKESFNSDEKLQMAAVYNWRSMARTAVANFCIGEVAPPMEPIHGEMPPPPPVQKRLSSCASCTLVSLWAVGTVSALAASMIVPYMLQRLVIL